MGLSPYGIKKYLAKLLSFDEVVTEASRIANKLMPLAQKPWSSLRSNIIISNL